MSMISFDANAIPSLMPALPHALLMVLSPTLLGYFASPARNGFCLLKSQ